MEFDIQTYSQTNRRKIRRKKINEFFNLKNHIEYSLCSFIDGIIFNITVFLVSILDALYNKLFYNLSSSFFFFF